MTATTGQRVSLEIQREPPPALNRQERMGWRKRHALRQMWTQETVTAWCNAGQPTLTRPIVTVLFFYHPYRTLPDPDARGVLVKPILDGLKGRAWPGDDDEQGISALHIRCYHSDFPPHVEIELVETGASHAE